MALLRCIPFDFYGTSELLRVFHRADNIGNISIGDFGPTNSDGIAAKGLRFVAGTGAGIEARLLPVSGNTAIVGIRVRISAYGSDSNLGTTLCLGDGSTAGPFQGSLDLNENGEFEACSGSILTANRSVLATSSYVMPLNTWVDIWTKVVIGNGTAGSFTVKVWEHTTGYPETPNWRAGQTIINVTGVDTQGLAGASFDGFGLGDWSDNGETDYAYAIFLDGSGSSCNDIMGPVTVKSLRANNRAVSALNDWAKSSGSVMADLLDDTTPDDDSTYGSSSTLDDEQTVSVDEADRWPVIGMQTFQAVRSVSGSPEVSPIAYQDGTAYVGTALAPGISYTYLQQPYSALPDGSSFKSVRTEDIDALQWGVKLTTDGGAIRVSQTVLAVIQIRGAGAHRHLLSGYRLSLSGQDCQMSGRNQTVIGDNNTVRGEYVTVIGSRNVVFNLDGVTRWIEGDDQFVIDGVPYGVFTGDSGSGGIKGLVPAPSAGDAAADKFLKADGTWDVPPGGGSPGAIDDPADIILTDAYASRPAAATEGRLFLPNNSFYLERDTGAAWAPWAPIFAMTQPPSSGWSWVQQGSSTVDSTNGGITLVGAATGSGANYVQRVRTAPSTPYVITAYLLPCYPQKQWMGVGLVFRQSSDGKLHAFHISSADSGATTLQIRSSKLNNATSFNSDYSGTVNTPIFYNWLRIADNGTNRILSYSANGIHWIDAFSVGRTDFLTADQVGFFVSTENAATPNWAPILTVLSWRQT